MGDPRRASVRDRPAPALDLADLAVFVAVVECGSFRHAGERLFCSQPSVSRTVARLESELGVKVLQRGPGGAVPTHAGQVLLAGARRLLAAAETVRTDVTEPGLRRVRIGATATSARTLLAPFLAGWMAEHPDLTVSGVEDTEADLLARLHAGDCDAAVVAGPLDLRTLEAWPLARVGVLAVMPHCHPLARAAAPATPVAVAELADVPLLLNGPRFPATVLLSAGLAAVGAEPHTVYESAVGQTLASMAEAGMGVAVFGETTDLRGFDLAVRPVAGHAGTPLEYDLHLAWPRSSFAPWKRELALDLTASVRAR